MHRDQQIALYFTRFMFEIRFRSEIWSPRGQSSTGIVVLERFTFSCKVACALPRSVGGFCGRLGKRLVNRGVNSKNKSVCENAASRIYHSSLLLRLPLQNVDT